MSTKNIKQLIKAKGDNTFERAMRMYGIKPKEAEKIFKSTDWADVDNGGGNGGSTPPSGGESGIECFYYNQEAVVVSFKDSWKYYSLLVKIKIDNMRAIVPSLIFIDALENNDETFAGATVEAVCIANPMIYSPDTGLIPFVEAIEMFDKYPFITKEQFYDLNA